MIKSFPTPAAYAAAGAPVDESRVAQIQSTGEIRIDGVNVLMDRPSDVCAVFEDPNGAAYYVRWDTIQKDRLSTDWTHVGYAFNFDGKRAKVLDKNFPSTTYKWLNCWQYAITAISAASIKFWLHMKGDYAVWVPIEVTLSDDTDGYINETTATEITAALEAAGNAGNEGYANHGYWAFLDGDHITVQCDFCADYRQYQFSDGSHALVGCTMALSVYGDMPASSDLWRKNGCKTYWGFLNVAKGESYYTTNGKTPTANWSLTAVDIVTKAAFETSAFCADLRAFYGTYHNYIVMNKVMQPHPDYGAFNLPDAEEMAARYAGMTFTKKDGTTDAKFPAMNSALSVGYGSGKFARDKWHLSDITDGAEYLEDETLAKLQEAQRRMNTTVITNSVYRWLSRRYTATNGWYFIGSTGTLNNTNVINAYRCQAVTLIDFD